MGLNFLDFVVVKLGVVTLLCWELERFLMDDHCPAVRQHCILQVGDVGLRRFVGLVHVYPVLLLKAIAEVPEVLPELESRVRFRKVVQEGHRVVICWLVTDSDNDLSND